MIVTHYSSFGTHTQTQNLFLLHDTEPLTKSEHNMALSTIALMQRMLVVRHARCVACILRAVFLSARFALHRTTKRTLLVYVIGVNQHFPTRFQYR